MPMPTGSRLQRTCTPYPTRAPRAVHSRAAAAFVALALTVLSAVRAGAQAQADTVVKLARAPLHAGTAHLVEELSIGVVDGAEEYLIGEVADLAVRDDGSMIAWDSKAAQVRQYDARGKFVRNIGRVGSGPGEYRSVSGVAVLKDGRLIVWDTGNWRMNIYTATGEPAGQWTTASGAAGSASATYSRGLTVDTDGFIYCRRTLFTRSFTNRPSVWIKLRPNGEVVDTLRGPELPAVPQLVARNGGATSSADLPLAPRAFTAFSPLGYFVTGYANRLSVEVHRPGQPLLSIRRDVPARTVPVAERSAERKRIEDMLRRTDPQWSWNGPELPSTKPAYGGLRVGADGRIWVAIDEEQMRLGSAGGPMGIGLSGRGGGGPRPIISQQKADEPPPRPATYDVFEPDGAYVGRVEIPPRVITAVMKGDTVWGVAYDADDVAYIKRYRLRWGDAK
jgi:hypothetical protein